jgi:hypothetical protein
MRGDETARGGSSYPNNFFLKTTIRGKRDGARPQCVLVEGAHRAWRKDAEPQKRESKLFRLQVADIPQNAQENVFENLEVAFMPH